MSSDTKTQKENKTILVVEDEQALQEAIKLKLKKDGVNVVTASSGEEALDYLKNNKPDLLWLDILLPGVDGIEVLRKVREDFKMNDLPVVIVSVSVGQEKVKQSQELEANDYIVKSEYNLVEIIKRVKKFL